MTETTAFFIKIGITFLCSGLAWLVMMRLQKKKQADADHSFEMKLKSRGMSLEIQEKNNDSQIPKE